MRFLVVVLKRAMISVVVLWTFDKEEVSFSKTNPKPFDLLRAGPLPFFRDLETLLSCTQIVFYFDENHSLALSGM